MYVSHRVPQLFCLLHGVLVGLLDLLVQLLHIGIEEDGYDYLEIEERWHIFDSLIIPIHADIGQQVNVGHKIVPLGGPIPKEFVNGGKLLITKSYMHLFGSNFINKVIGIFLVVSL
jgi:hypothetical protein